MSNIVECLRAAAQERHTINLEGDPLRFRDVKVEDDLRWQAADEIERLGDMIDNRNEFIAQKGLWQELGQYLSKPAQSGDKHGT